MSHPIQYEFPGQTLIAYSGHCIVVKAEKSFYSFHVESIVTEPT
jgi:hypothetical protein